MTEASNIIDQAFRSMKALHEYFGYVEGWVVIPPNDRREMYWHITDPLRGEVIYSPQRDQVVDYLATAFLGDDLYSNDIYTQRFLSQYVYRTAEFTMVCVDTNTDGNKFLAIYANDKEVFMLRDDVEA